MNLGYETWVEVYSIDEGFKWEMIIEDCLECIQNNLCYRNFEQYSGFLEWLKK